MVKLSDNVMEKMKDLKWKSIKCPKCRKNAFLGESTGDEKVGAFVCDHCKTAYPLNTYPSVQGKTFKYILSLTEAVFVEDTQQSESTY